jgi:hypothetical protein
LPLGSAGTKEDLAETARILTTQAAHFNRKYGEEQLPDFANLLSATTLEDGSIDFIVTAHRRWWASWQW